MKNEKNPVIGLKYNDIVLAIPKMSDEHIRTLIAFLQLEVTIRNNNKEDNKDDGTKR